MRKRYVFFFLAEETMSDDLALRAELMYPSFNTVFVREAIRIRIELRPKS